MSHDILRPQKISKAFCLYALQKLSVCIFDLDTNGSFVHYSCTKHLKKKKEECFYAVIFLKVGLNKGKIHTF